jgi:hypothetical protein
MLHKSAQCLSIRGPMPTDEGKIRTMLHEFITSYRGEIIARAREKVTDRPWPLVSTSELEHGVPLFLSQLSETLRSETEPRPFSPKAIGESAAKHGRELRERGFNISQVVHDYGDICQAITEVALEHKLPIRTEEFHTLNRCLDTAIAEAVTESTRASPPNRGHMKKSSAPGTWLMRFGTSSTRHCSRFTR